MADELKAGSLEGLGRAIARYEDALIDDAVATARARIESGPSGRAARSSSARFVALFAAAITVLAVVFGVLLFVRSRTSEPAPLADVTFETASVKGVVGDPIETAAQEVPVHFSDGTEVRFSGSTKARVKQVSPHGARVAIERGRASITVVPKASSQWVFDVGPFAVAVKGTRFDTGWDPVHEVFDLELHEGSVRVSGPTIEGEREVTSGVLRIALKIEEPSFDEPAPPPSSAPTAKTKPNAPSPAAPSWRALSAEGRYADAMTAVGSRFDSICESGSADDVVTLGDTARLSNDARRAKSAYEAVRRRFPSSAEAGLAAFALGRMAAHRADHREAARWFDVFSSERPNDRLAREALGRAMEAHDHAGNVAEARARADRYLTSYPDGPHAKLARKIKGE